MPVLLKVLKFYIEFYIGLIFNLSRWNVSKLNVSENARNQPLEAKKYEHFLDEVS
jgi:hypothetical protein